MGIFLKGKFKLRLFWDNYFRIKNFCNLNNCNNGLGLDRRGGGGGESGIFYLFFNHWFYHENVIVFNFFFLIFIQTISY